MMGLAHSLKSTMRKGLQRFVRAVFNARAERDHVDEAAARVRSLRAVSWVCEWREALFFQQFAPQVISHTMSETRCRSGRKALNVWRRLAACQLVADQYSALHAEVHLREDVLAAWIQYHTLARREKLVRQKVAAPLRLARAVRLWRDSGETYDDYVVKVSETLRYMRIQNCFRDLVRPTRVYLAFQRHQLARQNDLLSLVLDVWSANAVENIADRPDLPEVRSRLGRIGSPTRTLGLYALAMNRWLKFAKVEPEISSALTLELRMGKHFKTGLCLWSVSCWREVAVSLQESRLEKRQITQKLVIEGWQFAVRRDLAITQACTRVAAMCALYTVNASLIAWSDKTHIRERFRTRLYNLTSTRVSKMALQAFNDWRGVTSVSRANDLRSVYIRSRVRLGAMSKAISCFRSAMSLCQRASIGQDLADLFLSKRLLKRCVQGWTEQGVGKPRRFAQTTAYLRGLTSRNSARLVLDAWNFETHNLHRLPLIASLRDAHISSYFLFEWIRSHYIQVFTRQKDLRESRRRMKLVFIQFCELLVRSRLSEKAKWIHQKSQQRLAITTWTHSFEIHHTMSRMIDSSALSSGLKNWIRAHELSVGLRQLGAVITLLDVRQSKVVGLESLAENCAIQTMTERYVITLRSRRSLKRGLKLWQQVHAVVNLRSLVLWGPVSCIFETLKRNRQRCVTKRAIETSRRLETLRGSLVSWNSLRRCCAAVRSFSTIFERLTLSVSFFKFSDQTWLVAAHEARLDALGDRIQLRRATKIHIWRRYTRVSRMIRGRTWETQFSAFIGWRIWMDRCHKVGDCFSSAKRLVASNSITRSMSVWQEVLDWRRSVRLWITERLVKENVVNVKQRLRLWKSIVDLRNKRNVVEDHRRLNMVKGTLVKWIYGTVFMSQAKHRLEAFASAVASSLERSTLRDLRQCVLEAKQERVKANHAKIHLTTFLHYWSMMAAVSARYESTLVKSCVRIWSEYSTTKLNCMKAGANYARAQTLASLRSFAKAKETASAVTTASNRVTGLCAKDSLRLHFSAWRQLHEVGSARTGNAVRQYVRAWSGVTTVAVSVRDRIAQQRKRVALTLWKSALKFAEVRNERLVDVALKVAVNRLRVCMQAFHMSIQLKRAKDSVVLAAASIGLRYAYGSWRVALATARAEAMRRSLLRWKFGKSAVRREKAVRELARLVLIAWSTFSHEQSIMREYLPDVLMASVSSGMSVGDSHDLPFSHELAISGDLALSHELASHDLVLSHDVGSSYELGSREVGGSMDMAGSIEMAGSHDAAASSGFSDLRGPRQLVQSPSFLDDDEEVSHIRIHTPFGQNERLGLESVNHHSRDFAQREGGQGEDLDSSVVFASDGEPGDHGERVSLVDAIESLDLTGLARTGPEDDGALHQPSEGVVPTSNLASESPRLANPPPRSNERSRNPLTQSQTFRFNSFLYNNQ